MPSTLCRFALIMLFLAVPTHALRCRLYHKIWEDGHLLRINPDICHTSSKYCITATYSDPSDLKKNGFSMGCDKVDCAGIDDPSYTGWTENEKGMICRKHRDYGKKGEICCCTSDMCNSARNAFSVFLIFIFLIFLLF